MFVAREGFMLGRTTKPNAADNSAEHDRTPPFGPQPTTPAVNSSDSAVGVCFALLGLLG